MSDRVEVVKMLVDDVLAVDGVVVDSISRLYAPFILRDMFWNHKVALEKWIESE
jgi:hypothetical protein